jgi:hypothetical protein
LLLLRTSLKVWGFVRFFVTRGDLKCQKIALRNMWTSPLVKLKLGNVRKLRNAQSPTNSLCNVKFCHSFQNTPPKVLRNLRTFPWILFAEITWFHQYFIRIIITYKIKIKLFRGFFFRSRDKKLIRPLKVLCNARLFHWPSGLKKIRVGSVHKIRTLLGGGQRFVTNLCKNIGICTVLRYEGGGV